MKRISYLSLLALLPVVLPSCSGTTSPKDAEFDSGGALMSSLIQERLDQVPYQRKDELMNNLLWLAQVGEPAIPKLKKALNSDNAKLRSNSAYVLGAIGDRRVIPFLRKYISDENQLVRLEVARSLILLGEYEGMPELLTGLDSDHLQVRAMCFDALKSVTGKTFDYDHRQKDQALRRESIRKWKDWWTAQSGEAWMQSHDSAGKPAGPGK